MNCPKFWLSNWIRNELQGSVWDLWLFTEEVLPSVPSSEVTDQRKNLLRFILSPTIHSYLPIMYQQWTEDVISAFALSLQSWWTLDIVIFKNHWLTNSGRPYRGRSRLSWDLKDEMYCCLLCYSPKANYWVFSQLPFKDSFWCLSQKSVCVRSIIET